MLAKMSKRTSHAVCLAISWDFRGELPPHLRVLVSTPLRALVIALQQSSEYTAEFPSV